VSGGPPVTLELYVRSDGRWQIHANYGVDQHEECIDSAKALYASWRFEATRVVRETFNHADNRFHEEVLYRSPCRPKSKSRSSLGLAQARIRERRRIRNTAGPRKAARSGAAAVLPRIAVGGAISLGVAALTAFLFSMLLKNLPALHAGLGRTLTEAMLFVSFIGSFMVIFVPILRRELPSLRGRDAARTAAVEPAPPAEPPRPNPLPELATAVPEEPAPLEVLEVYPSAEDLDADTEDPGAEDESDESTEDDFTTEVSEAMAQVSKEMLQFIAKCLAPLAEAGRPLDNFNRFGLTLYFCGAGEYLASRSQLSKQEIEDLLCMLMQKLGHTLEMARGFCRNIEEYLINSKYFQMYEAGRSAMVRHTQDPDGALEVIEAVDMWNEPAAESQNRKEFVAVLFTDIVGSTALTQERGDDAAQLVVHVHNSIVREALALHCGREIKHTGDGIMATFPQVTNAVEGAVAMQQACQRANAADPELGLGLCIGVNAGEPIHEDGDIFGTPVQMAARVLSKAEGDEIAGCSLAR